MTSRRWWVTSLTLGVILSLTFILRAQDKVEPPPGDKLFSARMLAVYLKRDGSQGGVIEGARIRKIGEKTFIVGKGVETGRAGEWRGGLTVWLALDEVASMVEFDHAAQIR